MSLTTSGAAGILTPEQVGALVVQPLTRQSVALQASTLVTTTAHEFRIPVVTADPTAGFFAEGSEITATDPTLSEITVSFSKLAGLTVISNELASDSSPAALSIVGQGLVRDIADKIDAAFFGTTTSDGPDGVGNITSPTAVSTATGTTEWADLDPFTSAQFQVEEHNGHIDAWITNAADATSLAQLKDESGSNRPLLGTDATQAGRRTILGAPLLVSSHVESGVVWGISRNAAIIVLSEGTEVATDTSVFFSSDRVAVRAKLRLGFAFPNPKAIAKISLSAS